MLKKAAAAGGSNGVGNGGANNNGRLLKANGSSKGGGEEKDNRFPTPKCQELTMMGREVNTMKNELVIGRILANPRVLVTDCDVPTTVQEGCRYNALHIAAKSNNSQIIAYILNTVSSYEYMKLLFPYDEEETLR
jgi:hypothetical protein